MTARGFSVGRDGFGVAVVEAADAVGAWQGMGYACAEDRLWQMDHDRRRARGTLSAILGPSRLGWDQLARRLRLWAAAEDECATTSPEARRMLEAYCAGVNMAIADGVTSREHSALGVACSEWTPSDCALVFLVRHLLMGPWQRKLAMTEILLRSDIRRLGCLEDGLEDRLGPEVATRLAGAGPLVEGHGDGHDGVFDSEGGSNVWAVHGSRTASGLPILCNDSHRAAELPGVYWQASLRCPDFAVVGATFPGVPGFSHFGANGRVAWAITHGMADTQDLYLEQFRSSGAEHRVGDAWQPSQVFETSISVKDASPVPLVAFATDNGPIVAGDPATGWAIAMRWTAQVYRGTFAVAERMVHAGDVGELLEGQRDWVEPVNNLVCADTSGNIAHLVRGAVPVRSPEARGKLVLPGWEGGCRWQGIVAFGSLPRQLNPEAGFIVNCNDAPPHDPSVYISDSFAEPFRASRVRERLAVDDRCSVGTMQHLQGDVVSGAAEGWVALLRELGEPPSETARSASEELLQWDHIVSADSHRALMYELFRKRFGQQVVAALVGADCWSWMAEHAGDIGVAAVARRWAAHIPDHRERLVTALGRARWLELAVSALEWAFEEAHGTAADGAMLCTAWGERHHLAPRCLSDESEAGWSDAKARLGTAVHLGGDGDTVSVGGWSVLDPSAWFDAEHISVLRQTVDLAEPLVVRSVVPGGASGDTSSEAGTNQVPLWAGYSAVAITGR